jgi:outer membrane protein assembly factor BamE
MKLLMPLFFSSIQSRVCRLGLVALVLSSLVACGTFNDASGRVAGLVSPYKMDIVQGNFVSKEQAEALKVGMTRAQVRDILGTPLLASMFHADRWDYVFTFKRQGAEPQARKVSVYFTGTTLAKFEADTLPTETEFVATLDSGRRFGKAPVLQATEESLAKFAPDAKAAAATDPKSLQPLPERYPPLEPSNR